MSVCMCASAGRCRCAHVLAVHECVHVRMCASTGRCMFAHVLAVHKCEHVRKRRTLQAYTRVNANSCCGGYIYDYVHVRKRRTLQVCTRVNANQ